MKNSFYLNLVLVTLILSSLMTTSKINAYVSKNDPPSNKDPLNSSIPEWTTTEVITDTTMVHIIHLLLQIL